jgi:hypothetical protein
VLDRGNAYPCTLRKVGYSVHRKIYFFFLGFFFFTPLAAAGAPVVIAADGGGPTSSGADTSVSTGRRFCIFSIKERFKASKRLRNIDEEILNFRHCRSNQRWMDSCEGALEHTVVLSVIFKTNFPSDPFHFTQYRV